ncbi:SDR family oxidoreductase [Kineothrix sp. MSJ-39]|uniref:SDR family NAD(P)-dependent oxidoreductase n=1 Tax=Kineothrix sp. MSJ-39 TaxID=2841533 RepID=UPI001C1237AE|nr:SDR family oxidoreductase [Kineothrix sp. MSJ-39]MBU5428783.1 SDR family oxidoreductase [Kineothrix sp. MSJ-39]
MGVRNIIKNIIMMTKEEKKVEIPYYVDKDNLLSGKVALVCGGSGGIGQAIVKGFLQSGCKVIISGTNEKKLQKMQTELNSNNISILKFDYREVDKMNEFVEKAVSIYNKIDILVSSTGVHTENASFWNITPEEYSRVMDINLKGTFFACQAFGEYMKENGIQGHILIISSSRGDEPAWSPYGISKWGLKGLVEGMAKIFAPCGIIVNSIAPGATATELIGYETGNSIYCLDNIVNRYVMPEEVANLAKFMVSDMGNMIIGDTVRISGGRGCFDIR